MCAPLLRGIARKQGLHQLVRGQGLAQADARGTQKTNESFGVSLALLAEANQAARSLKRGSLGENVMYFETGQGSALSAGAHHGCDQQTLEARAYGVARAYEPLLVNTNHAEADQDDMDTLLTLLGAAGVAYVMGVPGADDVMLNYQSTSFHAVADAGIIASDS